MTKIGIEILKPFVYNVFIAAPKTKAAPLEGGAFPKGDFICIQLVPFAISACWDTAAAVSLLWQKAYFT